MPSKDLRLGRYSEPGRIYLVTTITADRMPIFEDFLHARLLIRELRRLHLEGLVDSLAWVVMPDHLHWLFTLESVRDLRGVMQLLKGRSARRINQQRGDRGRVWQTEYHDHALRRAEDVVAAARYVVANPLRGGLVHSLKQYPHWDACWL